jgi:hypothetical protein
MHFGRNVLFENQSVGLLMVYRSVIQALMKVILMCLRFFVLTLNFHTFFRLFSYWFFSKALKVQFEVVFVIALICSK